MATRTRRPPLAFPRSIGHQARHALAPLVGPTLLGLAVLLLGAAGDLLYHGLPDPLAQGFEPVLGAQAYRAHVLTLLGMVLMVVGVVVRSRRP